MYVQGATGFSSTSQSGRVEASSLPWLSLVAFAWLRIPHLLLLTFLVSSLTRKGRLVALIQQPISLAFLFRLRALSED